MGEAGCWLNDVLFVSEVNNAIKMMQTMQIPKNMTPFCFFDAVLLLSTWQGRSRHSQPSRFGSDFTVGMATNTCQVFHISHEVKRCRYKDLGWMDG